VALAALPLLPSETHTFAALRRPVGQERKWPWQLPCKWCMYVAEDGGRRTKKTNGGWNYQKTSYHCVECDLAFCGPENSLCWMNHVKYGPPQPDERKKRRLFEYWKYEDAQAWAAAAAAAAAAGAARLEGFLLLLVGPDVS